MRATHPLRLRRSSTLRRLTTFTAATTLALTIGSCNIGGSDEAPVISSLNAQEADAAAPDNFRNLMDNRPLSSAEGTVIMSTSGKNGAKDTVTGDLTTTVVSRDPSSTRFQWAVSIKPAVADQERTKYTNSAQSTISKDMDRSSTGSAVVSPDGRYLSLILLPAEQKTEDTAADQRTHIVVLDAKTGKTVRDATVSGVILGQALTNSTLAVETISRPDPAREPSISSP